MNVEDKGKAIVLQQTHSELDFILNVCIRVYTRSHWVLPGDCVNVMDL